MMISSNKYIFYHVPKTGGTWVTEMLSRISNTTSDTPKVKPLKRKPYFPGAHVTPLEVRPDRFSFCFFRNPLDWYISLWRYKNTRADWSAMREEGEYLYDIGAPSNNFNTFIRNIFKVHPEGFCTTVFKQYESVDFIGRYENLIPDLEKALKLSGESVNMSKLDSRPINKSDHSIVVKYTKKNIDMIKKADKYIFDWYNRKEGSI